MIGNAMISFVMCRFLTLVDALLLLCTDMIEARQAEGERLAGACGSNADNIPSRQGVRP